MKNITRRQFLKGGLGLGAAAFLSPLSAVAASCPRFPLTSVAVIKGLNIEDITEQALNSIGGMGSIVRPGERVFIKPNYIAGGLMGHDPVRSGEIPHPDVVATVARECVIAGASEVVIGEWFERPLHILYGGREGKEGAQIKRPVELINKRYGAKVFLVDLRRTTKKFIYIRSQTSLEYLAVPDSVIRADKIISVAVLKTHHTPISVTFGMKNFVGIMPSVLYGEPRMKLHEAGINQVILDIVRGIKPALTVISGVCGMEGEGVVRSFGGKSVDVAERIGGCLVLAGRDPVAVDATAARLITRNWVPRPRNEDLGVPWHITHLREACRQGIGEIRKSRINIVGNKLSEVAMSWEMPKGVYPEF